MRKCLICSKGETEVIHSHHVIPQSCGGKDGPQVDLCAEHHNMIHQFALKLVTSYRKGIVPEFIWPKNHGDFNVARYLVGEIVKATLTSKDKKYKFFLEFDQVQREMLELLKQEFGVTSITKAVYQCLDEVFKARFK